MTRTNQGSTRLPQALPSLPGTAEKLATDSQRVVCQSVGLVAGVSPWGASCEGQLRLGTPVTNKPREKLAGGNSYLMGTLVRQLAS